MNYVEIFFDILSYISLAGMAIFGIYCFFDKESRVMETEIKPSKPEPKTGEHKTRFSDSSLYDEVCELCGATDAAGDNRLDQPCPGKPNTMELGGGLVDGSDVYIDEKTNIDPAEAQAMLEKSLLKIAPNSLVYRLEERARIRRQIPSRKSVQEGKPDRIADLLEEAAGEIKALKKNSIPVSKIEALAKHLKENAGALRQWVEQEDEARCRELCAMYLEELVTTLRIEQRIELLNKQLADFEEAMGPFDNVEDVIKAIEEDDKNE